MSAGLTLIGKTLQSLQPALADEECAGCECLQGALVELRLALEDLAASAAQLELLGQVEAALHRSERHACLGCQPCDPGDILAAFYREQQAHESTPQPACSDG